VPNLDSYAARRPHETAVVVLEPRGGRRAALYSPDFDLSMGLADLLHPLVPRSPAVAPATREPTGLRPRGSAGVPESSAHGLSPAMAGQSCGRSFPRGRGTHHGPPDPGDGIPPNGGLRDVLAGNGKVMSSTTETVERERKFEAAEDVRVSDVPDASVIDGSKSAAHRHVLGHSPSALAPVGPHVAPPPGVRPVRRSFGHSSSRSRPGRRRAKRRHAEVHVTGSGLYPPRAIRQLARAVVRRGVFMPIATIITDRRRVRLAGRDRTDRINLSDDHVSSIVGLRRGPAFRQIQVEAVSPEADELIDGCRTR
jgi:hypothetical protein